MRDDNSPMEMEDLQPYGESLLAGFCFALGAQIVNALWSAGQDAITNRESQD